MVRVLNAALWLSSPSGHLFVSVYFPEPTQEQREAIGCYRGRNNESGGFYTDSRGKSLKTSYGLRMQTRVRLGVHRLARQHGGPMPAPPPSGLMATVHRREELFQFHPGGTL